jgi:hypothetical protein
MYIYIYIYDVISNTYFQVMFKIPKMGHLPGPDEVQLHIFRHVGVAEYWLSQGTGLYLPFLQTCPVSKGPQAIELGHVNIGCSSANFHYWKEDC